MVIATRKPLCNKRWSASPASQDLQLTQLRHPWGRHQSQLQK
ncbi:Uncharacterised protein [Klebsiella pneumoniae]|nr:Uncharacterised protein [Klebsiella pneumoniae]